MEIKHSDTSPSSMGRISKCVGSAAIARRLPPNKSTIYMAQGSVAHFVAEKMIRQEECPEGTMLDYEGFSYEVVEIEGTRKLDTIALEYVRQYADYILALRAQYPNALFGSESRFKMFGKDIDGSDRYGTTDDWLWVPCVMLKITDFKYGAGTPVEVEHNEQLLDYALAVWDGLEEWQKALTPIIEISVFQPRGMGGGLRNWQLTPQELENYRVVLADILRTAAYADELFDEIGYNMEAAEWEGKFLFAGEHCEKHFCPNQANCPTLAKFCTKNMQADYANLLPTLAPAESLPAPGNLPAVSEMPDEFLIRIKQAKGVIESWMGAAEDELNRRAMAGKDYTDLGLKLVETRTQRRLVPDALQQLVEAGFEQEKVTKPAPLKNLGDLDKLVPAEIMEKITTKPKGKTVLAPLTDKRPRIEPPNAAEDFAGLEIAQSLVDVEVVS